MLHRGHGKPLTHQVHTVILRESAMSPIDPPSLPSTAVRQFRLGGSYNGYS
jgi:hypothetical protein